jgi:hypothetical protein
MPYRVKQDGTIETDTPEEAVALAALLDRKKYGRRPNAAGNGLEPVELKKNGTRRRGKPKTRGRVRRPSGAVDNGVKLGQIYRRHTGGTSAGREIQVAELLSDGIMPRILKEAPGTKRKSVVKKISYHQLRRAYKLIKDV